MAEESVILQDIHVGNAIVRHLKEIGEKQSYLARLLDMPTSNLTRILKRHSMETHRLFDICMKLDYNFFALFGNDTDLLERYSLGEPEIGLCIERRLNKIQMLRADFASALGVKPTDVSRILKRTSFETDKLLLISRILNYNFFKDFYHEVPSSVEDQDKSIKSFIETKYDEMLLENNRLKNELDLVKKELSSVKKENKKLKKENVYLKTKLTDAGIEF